MQVKKTLISDTEVTVHVAATDKELAPLKDHVLQHFQNKVKVPGFRAGKVPATVLEKNVDQNLLQTEFLEEALQQLYVTAIDQLHIRPVDQPKVTLKKFVPFSTLEFEATTAVIGEIKLPDYKKIKKTKPKPTITADDVKEILNSLQKRMAEYKDVDRPAKAGDKVWIDFKGTDDKGQAIQGAEGKDYPLELGSNTFIPGFEDNLVGTKAGQEKTFDITFPKDYAAAGLASKKVTFAVSATKVQEPLEAKLDDDFAAKAGPFKSLAELKADIKKQLGTERQNQADRDFESELIKDISAKSKVAIPEVLINDQIERLLRDLRQNLTYRGQTMQEFLQAQGKTEDQYRKDVLEPEAKDRVKASLVLAEIAEQEKLDVSNQELDDRMALLRSQYEDPQMQTELAKPEARRDIAARLLTEKTMQKLTSYATAK